MIYSKIINSYIRFGKPLKNIVDEPENEVPLGIVKENKQGGKELFFEISTSAWFSRKLD